MISRKQYTSLVYLDEYTQVSTRVEFQFKSVGHLGHDEAMEAGCREFDPRPGH